MNSQIFKVVFMARKPTPRQTGLSALLRGQLEKLGINQSELGRRAHVSSGQMTNVMRYGMISGPEIVKALARAAEIDEETALQVAGISHPADVPQEIPEELRDFVRRLYRLSLQSRQHVMNTAYIALRQEEKRLPPHIQS